MTESRFETPIIVDPHVYTEDEARAIANAFVDRLMDGIQEPDPEFIQMVDEDFWELVNQPPTTYHAPSPESSVADHAESAGESGPTAP